MKKMVFFLLTLVSIGIATDEFVKGLIEKLMEKGQSAWWWNSKWWDEGYIENVPNYRVRVETAVVKKKDIQT